MKKGFLFVTLAGIGAGALAAFRAFQAAGEKNDAVENEELKAPAHTAASLEEVVENRAEKEEIPQNGIEKDEIDTKKTILEDEDAASDLCYYLPGSKIWHSNDTCAFIAGKEGVVTSTVAKAVAAGKTRGCSRCGA